jgi:hypothetical protein
MITVLKEENYFVKQQGKIATDNTAKEERK